MLRNLLLILGVVSLLSGCSSEPQPIKYDLDVCGYCKMQITDTRYGSEILTKKGKAYKFDSFECLIDFNKENTPEVGQYLVTSFDQPNVLVDGNDAWVVKCTEMPSPMGRYLTVFKKQEVAQEIIAEKGGEMLPLNEALTKF